jgi:hypothetical protein
LNYLNLIQEKCREKWSTFNLSYCIFGLALIFLSIISLLVFSSILNDDANINDLVLGNLSISLTKNVFSIFVLYFFIINATNTKLSSTIWVCSLYFNLIILFKFKNQFLKISTLFNFLKQHYLRVDYLFIYFSFLIPFSNSFVIRENNSLRFLLVSFLFLDLYSKLRAYKPSLGSILSKLKQLTLILFLVRISFIFYVCREELLTLNCTQTVFSTQFSKLNLMENSYQSNFLNNTTLFYSSILIFNFACFIKIFQMVSNVNLKSRFGNVNIKQLFYLQIFILFIYMIIQFKLNINAYLNLDEKIKYQNELLKTINLFLAKLIYVLFLLAQAIIWYPRTELDTNKQIFYEKRVKSLILSLSLVLTLVMSESFLSIWIIVLIINLYNNYSFSWSTSKESRISL